MSMIRVLIVFSLLSIVGNASADWRDDLLNRGYLQEMVILMEYPSESDSTDDWRFINNIHLRNNFKWYASNSVTVGVEIKTNLNLGEGRDLLNTDNFGASYFDWDREWVDDALISSIDRAWLDWSAYSLQLRVGRQRIAWGTCLVWNPIDLFNPASPLDFYSVEKPGTDAIRVQYYIGNNSKIEAAYSPKREIDESIGAVRLVLNGWGYDWMLLTGKKGNQSVVGLAWTGDVFGAGFRGEVLHSNYRLSGQIYTIVSIDIDYTFSNSLYLHSAILSNYYGSIRDVAGNRLDDEIIDRDFLSPSKLSLFNEIRFQPTPLLSISGIGILNPNDNSFFIGPSLTWSVITNADLSVTGLLFEGEAETEFGDSGDMFLLKLRYSF